MKKLKSSSTKAVLVDGHEERRAVKNKRIRDRRRGKQWEVCGLGLKIHTMEDAVFRVLCKSNYGTHWANGALLAREACRVHLEQGTIMFAPLPDRFFHVHKGTSILRKAYTHSCPAAP